MKETGLCSCVAAGPFTGMLECVREIDQEVQYSFCKVLDTMNERSTVMGNYCIHLIRLFVAFLESV
jgi:hypothetical protein